MYERFTDRARKAMALANQEAQRFNHEYLGTEHVLLGIIMDGSNFATKIIESFGVDPRKVRLEVEKHLNLGPAPVTMGKLAQTPRCKLSVGYAIEAARSLNHNYVGTEHLLLGLLREANGTAAAVLTGLGMTRESATEKLVNLKWKELVGEPADPEFISQATQLAEIVRKYQFHFCFAGGIERKVAVDELCDFYRRAFEVGVNAKAS